MKEKKKVALVEVAGQAWRLRLLLTVVKRENPFSELVMQFKIHAFEFGSFVTDETKGSHGVVRVLLTILASLMIAPSSLVSGILWLLLKPLHLLQLWLARRELERLRAGVKAPCLLYREPSDVELPKLLDEVDAALRQNS